MAQVSLLFARVLGNPRVDVYGPVLPRSYNAGGMPSSGLLTRTWAPFLKQKGVE